MSALARPDCAIALTCTYPESGLAAKNCLRGMPGRTTFPRHLIAFALKRLVHVVNRFPKHHPLKLNKTSQHIIISTSQHQIDLDLPHSFLIFFLAFSVSFDIFFHNSHIQLRFFEIGKLALARSARSG